MLLGLVGGLNLVRSVLGHVEPPNFLLSAPGVYGDEAGVRKGLGGAVALNILGAVEHLDELALRSKFADLQTIPMRTQHAMGERAIALAAIETVEAQLNHKRALSRSVLQP